MLRHKTVNKGRNNKEKLTRNAVYLTCRERRSVFHSLLQRSDMMPVAVTENTSVTRMPV